jgi:hypothetical protein
MIIDDLGSVLDVYTVLIVIVTKFLIFFEKKKRDH